MSEPTVVIIGGGVTGLSTAYHLALRNFGRIIVIDKGPIGDGSSGRAAAIITGLLWTEAGVRARKIALRRYRELSKELPGYQFQTVGCLNWFDRTTWAEREALLPLYDRCDAPYEILNASEITRRWPALRPPDDFIGLFDPLGGYSEPDEYIPALANRCRQLGVEILERTKITSILKDGNCVRGVQTASGTYESDSVVVTSYAWTNHILATVGRQLPIRTFVGQRHVTRPLPAGVEIPATNANPLHCYVRPAAGRRLLIGIEPNPEEWKVQSMDFHMNELSPSPLSSDLLASVCQTLPALESAQWESCRIGLLMFAADNEPILGPVADLEGLYVGIAFHSGGFAYNPASGLLLSQFVADGQTEIDVSAFSPDRFDPTKAEEYLAQRTLLEQAVSRRH